MEQIFDQKLYDLANQAVYEYVQLMVAKVQSQPINMAYLGVYAETEQEMPVVDMRHSESDAGDVYTVISPLFIYTIKLGKDGSLEVYAKGGHDHIKSGEMIWKTYLAREGHTFNIAEINKMFETPIESDDDYVRHIKGWFVYIDEELEHDAEDANVKTSINTEIDDARVASGKLGDKAFRAQNGFLEALIDGTNDAFYL